MKIYMVGGAVRDKLLNYPIIERDWVITGAMPEHLIEQGYKQVGKDFPVFLHPESKEEYALARTERQIGKGYKGFSCYFSPTVTLEQDLIRRDITINAMAMDKHGKIIDPYQGQNDLKQRLIRHVSSAFIEDPVRVLRVARFASRYHHLGFKIAPETRSLMYKMVKNGDLDYLVPERIWQEWLKSLKEKNPEIFITALRSCDALNTVLPEIDALFGVPNSKHYHPEVDSGIHTLQTLVESVKLSDDPEIRFAALTHDLGKASTPLIKWPSHHDHDKKGSSIIKKMSDRLRIPVNYRDFASLCSLQHLNIHRFNELRPDTKVKMLDKLDAFRRPERFNNLLDVCESDARGGGKTHYPQKKAWKSLLDACMTITPQSVIAEGYQGKEIKNMLHERRIICAKKLFSGE